MIDTYAWIGIVFRVVAEAIFVLILVQQIIVFRGKSDYKKLQVLLLIALFLLTFSNGFTLTLNFFRQADGNLQEVARHAGTISGALTTLGAAVSLYLINRFKLK